MPIILLFVLIIGAFLAGDVMMNPQVESVPTEEIPVETLTPTLQPTVTPIPKVKDTRADDPFIDCKFPHSGLKKLKLSECSISTDCQVGNEWIPMKKDECSKVQNANLMETLGKLKNIIQQNQPSQSLPATSETNYSEYYNNTLRYFSETENCYSKAVDEVKAGNVPTMTATVNECQNIVRNARKEIDKLFYAPNLSRVQSNLGSAWGWYLNVLDGMWILGVEIADPPYDISDSLKTKNSAMLTARTYVEGAKREWEAANK